MSIAASASPENIDAAGEVLYGMFMRAKSRTLSAIGALACAMVFLGSCAPREIWVRPENYSKEQARQDYEECHRRADAATSYQTRYSAPYIHDDTLDACMRSKGYSLIYKSAR